MRVFLVWLVSALFILLAISLGSIFGVSKHVFIIWFGTIYMIINTFKRYNDEKYNEVISKTIIATIILSFVAVALTVVDIFLIMQRNF